MFFHINILDRRGPRGRGRDVWGLQSFRRIPNEMEVHEYHGMGRDDLSSGIAHIAKAYSSRPNYHSSLKAPGPELYLNDPWSMAHRAPSRYKTSTGSTSFGNRLKACGQNWEKGTDPRCPVTKMVAAFNRCSVQQITLYTANHTTCRLKYT